MSADCNTRSKVEYSCLLKYSKMATLPINFFFKGLQKAAAFEKRWEKMKKKAINFHSALTVQIKEWFPQKCFPPGFWFHFSVDLIDEGVANARKVRQLLLLQFCCHLEVWKPRNDHRNGLWKTWKRREEYFTANNGIDFYS